VCSESQSSPPRKLLSGRKVWLSSSAVLRGTDAALTPNLDGGGNLVNQASEVWSRARSPCCSRVHVVFKL
jgi:hypothetical protein